MSGKEEFQLSSSVSSQRKGQHTYNTKTANNYQFLPSDLGTLTSASGKHLKFSGITLFNRFNKNFGSYLEYQLYIENAKTTQTIYLGKDIKKTLGAIYKIGAGHLIVLPMLKFDESVFMDIEKGSDGKKTKFWNEKGLAFGNNLFSSLLEIDNKLTDGFEKTPSPDWTTENQYMIKNEIVIHSAIAKNIKAIAKLEQESKKLNLELEETVKLKDLLFENGKLLESAVIKALKILGYQAEGYDDGDLEMDQIITSPEKHRYIGECEGKDSKDIDVTKFRQLQDALNADFARDEVEEKAFGILFGNADRLTDPKSRKLDFTLKCKTGAEREKIALVKTVDLFVVARYLAETEDDDYKKACRQAIHQCLGKIVEFPKVPNSGLVV